MDSTHSIPPEIDRIQRPALIVGILFTLISLAGAFATTDGLKHFFQSYLLGYVFWIGIALGSLALLMLQHLSGGAWGLMIRRVLEASTRTLLPMLVLFIPIAIGATKIYEWTHGVAGGPEAHGKQTYLNLKFFFARTAAYFAIWLIFSTVLNKLSGDQDRSASKDINVKMRTFSGPGLAFFVLAVTFASIDWVMSIDPHWYSTIFGLLFVAGWALSALAFVIAVMVLLMNEKPFAGVLAASHMHDLGKLLLALVMIWAYFNFSQFLIIWSGNIPEETKWYIPRMRGAWGAIGLVLVVFHFAFPFLLLLSRDLKRNAKRLAIVAIVVLAMRFVDLLWLIVPSMGGEHGTMQLSWMNFVVPLGIGGIWLAVFAWQLKRRPLLPFNDPYLKEVIERGDSH